MSVNVKLLKKVRRLIAEDPRRLRMRTWGEKTWVRFNDDPPSCGTVACLAGWIILAATPKHRWKRLFDSNGFLSIGKKSVKTNCWAFVENCHFFRRTGQLMKFWSGLTLKYPEPSHDERI